MLMEIIIKKLDDNLYDLIIRSFPANMKFAEISEVFKTSPEDLFKQGRAFTVEDLIKFMKVEGIVILLVGNCTLSASILHDPPYINNAKNHYKRVVEYKCSSTMIVRYLDKGVITVQDRSGVRYFKEQDDATTIWKYKDNQRSDETGNIDLETITIDRPPLFPNCFKSKQEYNEHTNRQDIITREKYEADKKLKELQEIPIRRKRLLDKVADATTMLEQARINLASDIARYGTEV